MANSKNAIEVLFSSRNTNCLDAIGGNIDSIKSLTYRGGYK